MIKIVIIDDQSLMRDGLKIILGSYKDFEIVACGENGIDAIKLAETYSPDIILMDIRMPIMDGVEATRIIKEKHTDINVLLLTTFEDEEYIVNAMKAGASGYIFKDIEKDKLAEVIHDCVKGTLIMPTKVAAVLAKYVSEKEPPNNKIDMPPTNSIDWPLTDRESEIAVMVSQGFTNKQIASALYISDGTVKNYVSTIYGKLGFKDRIKLALYLKENGL